MATGYLALILHAHLPFVRHPEHEDFLEEDWFFEAITESYVPLIGMMQRLVRDEVPFKLTMTVTPTLCAMLQDELLRERYVRYLDRAKTPLLAPIVRELGISPIQYGVFLIFNIEVALITPPVGLHH